MIRRPFLLAIAFTNLLQAGLPLVVDGSAKAVLVIPRHPAKKSSEVSFSDAAKDLIRIIQKSSGASLSLKTLGRTEDGGRDGVRDFLGCTPEGMEAPVVTDEEGFRVQTIKDGLVFTVNVKVPTEQQERAMHYAVNRFAEKMFGCRWLMPGALGEVIPEHKTIVLDDVAFEEKTVFWSRRMEDRQDSGHTERLAKVRATLDAADKDGPAMGAGDWLERMNMGRRFPFEFGHSFGGWWEQFGKGHPEYFALQADGTRTQHPPRERLCESEPKLWDAVAAKVVAAFEADPDLRMFSICENDGGHNQFCMCPRCMALDPPNAPKVTDFEDIPSEDRRGLSRRLSFAERPRVHLLQRNRAAREGALSRPLPRMLPPTASIARCR